jgi:L-aspartate oxidase
MHSGASTEVLVIGCGIGGGVAALTLADAGVPVTVVTRAETATESNTWYAQGGIIFRGVGDSSRLLAEDILRAGAGHCHLPAVTIAAEEGPDLVQRILVDRVGVPFDRDESGALSLAREGSHALPRVAHAADATGQTISAALVKVLQDHPNVSMLTAHTAVDLLTPSPCAVDRRSVYAPLSCAGAYLLDQATGRVVPCLAGHTVLATGGLGQIFLRTTNPVGARGDGMAMAHRAGARVINMEFVQFHPTTFFHDGAARFLVSEAVRGAGARLVLADGEPFMDRHAPEWKDLAPRDVVARAIHHEMLTRDVPNVYLDVRSYLAPDQIRTRFPNIHRDCLAYGVDITRDLVPVVPAAHYACGGVWVDEWGRTSVDRLYAAGEVSCTGLHGANRLASASLLEGLVWGHRAARAILRAREAAPAPAIDVVPWPETSSERADPALVTQDVTFIKHIMWNYVGLVRTTGQLGRALRALRALETEIEDFYGHAKLTDGLIGLQNSVRVALLVAGAAWQNPHSMGCHFRRDDP